ncbi:hypothetical protein OHV08_00415 [Streptomyces canus]|uniref:hypothetical protein n=1 Tax=Streptomyces canus TaxID=58343 RepID=UPI0032438BF7
MPITTVVTAVLHDKVPRRGRHRTLDHAVDGLWPNAYAWITGVRPVHAVALALALALVL